MATRAGPRVVGVAALAEAAALLRRGGLVAFPTETVYGLGANALDVGALRRVFAAKGRPADNPLIIHVASIDRLASVAATITPLAAELAARYWPGPLTLVLDAASSVPALATGGHPTVGVRVPDHPLALALLAAADVPVAAPSANASGRPSPTSPAHVLADLGDRVDLVVDGGRCGVGVESTVVDARGSQPVVLREGAVTREALATVDDQSEAASPGTRYRHYAPACRVRVAHPSEVTALAEAAAAAGQRVGVVVPAGTPVPAGAIRIAGYEHTEDLARRLYQAFRDGEEAGLELLVVAAVPEDGLGRAVMDRLRRAEASAAP